MRKGNFSRLMLIITFCFFFITKCWSQTLPSNIRILNEIKQIFKSDTNNRNYNTSDSFIVAKFTGSDRNECISISQIDENTNKTFILWYKDSLSQWIRSDWYKINYHEIKVIDINNDSIFEIILIRKDTNNDLYTKKLELISINGGEEKTLFYITEFEHIANDDILKSLEKGSIISKRHKLQFKDLNNDGTLDIKDKITKKYLKSRACSCDDDFEYKIEKKIYYFIDGNYESRL